MGILICGVDDKGVVGHDVEGGRRGDVMGMRIRYRVIQGII